MKWKVTKGPSGVTRLTITAPTIQEREQRCGRRLSDINPYSSSRLTYRESLNVMWKASRLLGIGYNCDWSLVNRFDDGTCAGVDIVLWINYVDTYWYFSLDRINEFQEAVNSPEALRELAGIEKTFPWLAERWEKWGTKSIRKEMT